MKQVSFNLILLGSLAGCSAFNISSEQEIEEFIRTERKVYVAEQIAESHPSRPIYSFEVVATFENKTEETIYLRQCVDPFPVYGLRDVSSKANGESPYGTYGVIEIHCRGGPPAIVVGPSGVRVDTVHIYGPTSWDGFTGEYYGELEGRFRLSYDGGTCLEEGSIRIIGGDCRFLPSEWPQSNIFEVRLED